MQNSRRKIKQLGFGLGLSRSRNPKIMQCYET